MSDPRAQPVESTKIITGIDLIQEDWKKFALKAKKLDVYFDKNAITIATQTSTYRDTYIALKKKGVEIRVITEITKENLDKAKVLTEIVGQLRHLENSHGAMAVSNTEFRATSYLPKDAYVPQAIVSDNSEFVKQQQYIFDILWRTATPAELRFKEIEEGVIKYKTEIITDTDEIISAIKVKYSNVNELLLCLNSGGLQVVYNNYLDNILKALENKQLGIGKGVRMMTFINTENIELVKKFLELGITVRHVTHLPPMSFSCSEKHTFLTVEEMKDGTHATRLLSSNESTFLNHFTSIFERFWKTGIDAKIRVADIERGGNAEDIEIIYNTSEAKDLYVQLLKSAQKEIKIIYPTANAFLRQKKFDVPQMVIDAAKRGVTIRIIASNSEKIREFFTIHDGLIQIRFLEKQTEPKTTFLIIDNKYTLDLEIKDDLNMLFEEAIGFSTYSSSKASVQFHVAIFDNLWIQSKLYTELKESSRLLEIVNQKLENHYNMQKEFIDVAAHELRTPIQPILGLSEVLRNNMAGRFEIQIINVIVKNALRLQELAENILDVSRIEGGTLNLKKEKFDISILVHEIINDFKYQVSLDAGKKKLEINYKITPDLIVFADKLRMTQVFTNLLNNAIKFTEKGTIDVTMDKDDNNIIINIIDSGRGIDEDVLFRIFEKFVTKSDGGMGLGLFITKGIVEKHGGKIYAENNKGQRGAKFSAILPIAIT